MKKELFAMTREDASDESSYVLEYYLTEQELLYKDTPRKAYGVEVRKLMRADDACGMTETETVNDVFCNRASAEGFIRLITDCKVTPAHLKDIILDFISDGDIVPLKKLQSA